MASKNACRLPISSMILVLLALAMSFAKASAQSVDAAQSPAPSAARIGENKTSDSLKPILLHAADGSLTLAGVAVSIDSLSAKLAEVADKAQTYLDLRDDTSASRGAGRLISRICEIAQNVGLAGIRHDRASSGWLTYQAPYRSGSRTAVPLPPEASRRKTLGVDEIEFFDQDGFRARLRGRTALMPPDRWQCLTIDVSSDASLIAQAWAYIGSRGTSQTLDAAAPYDFDVELALRRTSSAPPGAKPRWFSIEIGPEPNGGLDEMAESVSFLQSDTKEEKPGHTTLRGHVKIAAKTDNQSLAISADKIEIFDEADGRKHLACQGNVQLEVLAPEPKN